ncbi:radical SAM family heme chaperone HemW [Balneola sp. MJW-20]|uniref:radical SAM family heme chaperone HemW n=1 Tax=Gracilimonas aurantiaca TaxID=3234185 RepID=UPI0034669DFD
MAGIYIHVPFCKQACSYCDFYFVTRDQERNHYVEALITQINHYADTFYSAETIKTVYIGGGTPSLLSISQLKKIYRAVQRVFNLDLEEFTLEMNPDDVEPEYLRGLMSLGVNRCSMGVQSFDEDLLKFMNRSHTADQAVRAMELLGASGFDIYTVDLIYGNPGQSLNSLNTDLKSFLAFDPPHISAYSLTVEPRTRLGKMYENGKLKPLSDEKTAEHFDLVSETLTESGMNHYEVSNFAKPGKEAVHNTRYWNHENYLGLGPGAHSFWWNEDQKTAIRWLNRPDLRKYLSGNFEHAEAENLRLYELAEERLMLGLRTSNGISTDELEKKYEYQVDQHQLNYIYHQSRSGKLTYDEGLLRLTREGLKVADAIILDLISLKKPDAPR